MLLRVLSTIYNGQRQSHRRRRGARACARELGSELLAVGEIAVRAAMEKPRQVARKFLARPQHEGAGAVVRRSIGRYVGFPFVFR